ncbi:hypothetical protein M406DRAFT_73810 [Cryphonectria parasitica EP155]|uniref:Uncharacterized protein n=1 Tax=Cryphonectria parasitica (strain ATCC 38755 / EP155) TaxID=660469 RepID=A0A9P4XY73_CRYP1|nr:uncharacterized protein M406DRAFT_73810 [Cryphonectria parasitica EP155]KAF3763183.1 hypothetical protein M406DRAFT_73810 [Cryphonectria parasitica EP155]
MPSPTATLTLLSAISYAVAFTPLAARRNPEFHRRDDPIVSTVSYSSSSISKGDLDTAEANMLDWCAASRPSTTIGQGDTWKGEWGDGATSGDHEEASGANVKYWICDTAENGKITLGDCSSEFKYKADQMNAKVDAQCGAASGGWVDFSDNTSFGRDPEGKGFPEDYE